MQNFIDIIGKPGHNLNRPYYNLVTFYPHDRIDIKKPGAAGY